ncbi:MAG: DUF1579 domain-containing protein [Planctomycetota bacterium]
MLTTKSIVRTAAVCLTAALTASPVLAGDPTDLGKQVAEEMMKAAQDPAAMQKWMASGQPGVAHEFLVAAFVGEWDVTMKMWMDPEGEPTVAEGTSTVTEMLEGRFIREEFTVPMMGMPFTGIGFTGYDNNRKLFVASWMDTMSTGISTMAGSVNEDGTVLTFVGEMNEPMTGQVGKAYMSVNTIHGPDHHTFEMWEVLYGEPFKVMQIEYRRSGSADAN